MLDIENDRHHEKKRKRPFASGEIPLWHGAILAPLLLLLASCGAIYVGAGFAILLALYFLLTNIYSFCLKSYLLVDCITLALLYALRIIAGGIVSSTTLSVWLLAFSIFLFFSLAVVKRYAELARKIKIGEERVYGRAYINADLPLLQTFGVASGYIAVLVLALYINGNTVQTLYSTPEIIWGSVPIMLFWISWIWMQAYRGNMKEDPILFAVKDKVSLLCGILFACIFLAASFSY